MVGWLVGGSCCLFVLFCFVLLCLPTRMVDLYGFHVGI